jgi:hypothetical protein
MSIVKMPKVRRSSSSAADMELAKEMKTWPIHAKLIGRIELDALSSISASQTTLTAWQHEIQWLRNDDIYAAVPILDATNIPVARYKRPWLKQLLECGVISPIAPENVRGHVKMFAVPEEAKKRFRSIKHTVAINQYCGRETLTPVSFPTKKDIANFVNQGDCFIALDFAAYYDQFTLSPEISTRMCFGFDNRTYCLKTLPMGQRQAVAIANAATQLLLDFDKHSQACRSIIDNIIFVGTHEQVVHDAWIFIQRCKQVNATLNEVDVQSATQEEISKLVKITGDWAGIHLDFSNKTVCLMEKAITKTTNSWQNQENWTWRDYAAHVGLLFWAWNILDIPVSEFFDVLRFNSMIGKAITALQPPPLPDGTYPKNPAWEFKACIWPHVLPVLEIWTKLVLKNSPRFIRPLSSPQLLIECDASGIGYGYVSYNIETDELFSWGMQWTEADKRIHGLKLGKSTYSEPMGMRLCIQHALSRNKKVSNIAVGTDNTVTEASYNRGFNSHSFHINRCLKLKEREFPSSKYTFTFVHVPGTEILGDAPSRGQIDCKLHRDEMITMLRRHLGCAK